VWKDEYSVGVRLFDEQHKHFFEITNEIYELLENGRASRETLLAVVDKMSSYIHYHLFSEDEIFHLYDYPDAKSHIKAHQGYSRKIKQYMNKLLKVKSKIDYQEMVKELLDFASQWLSWHILETDKKYSEFFKGKEIG
jgi:hemerythrin